MNGRCAICKVPVRFAKHPKWVATGGVIHKVCYKRKRKRK